VADVLLLPGTARVAAEVELSQVGEARKRGEGVVERGQLVAVEGDRNEERAADEWREARDPVVGRKEMCESLAARSC